MTTNQARIVDYAHARRSVRSPRADSHASGRRARSHGHRQRSVRTARGAAKSQPKGVIGSRMEQVRQQQRKRRASRAFDRSDYGRTNASTSGARAAVHTGSMGARQRKASRTYAQGSPYAGAAKAAAGGVAGLVGSFASRQHGVRFYVLSALLACTVLSGAFLYPAAQDYYIAIRDNAQAQAEYDALQDYYEQLQGSVATLSTDEGVETRAHDLYGWVSAGDNSVMVQGAQAESDFDATKIGIVPSGSVKAPDTWYSGILDPFFGYENG